MTETNRMNDGYISNYITASENCEIYSAVIASLYGLLFLIDAFQVIRIVLYKHKLLSFHFGFSIYVLFWMFMRSFFFFAVFLPPWPDWISRILYWPVTNIQFATYSLLIWYFARYVYRNSWETFAGPICAAVYIFSNLLLLSFTIVWLAIAGKKEESELNRGQILAQIFFTAITFLTLTLLMGYYGWMFITILDKAKNKSLVLPMGGSAWQIKLFYIVALVVFSFRYAFDFAAIGIDFEQEEFGVDNMCLPDLLSFFVLLIWEILPTAMLLFFFRKIPKTLSRFGNRITSTNPHPPLLAEPIENSSPAFFFPQEIEDDSTFSGSINTPPGAYITGHGHASPVADTNPRKIMSYGSSSSMSPSPHKQAFSK